ncbi:MAG: hypothetical protein LC751_03490 [Actinobacteria bacterium]|nr:hypothetical protein [Actinomycetota bacterium]
MGNASRVPDVPGADREEGSSQMDQPNEVPGSPRAGAATEKRSVEEDWASLGTDDPAFWIKD